MASHGVENELLALALAAGKTVAEAAAAAGISERTAIRRRADPAFRRRVSELRAQLVDRALGTMADAMAEAAEVLRKLLADSTPATVRLGAARALLELGAKLRGDVEHEERLQRLEQLLERLLLRRRKKG